MGDSSVNSQGSVGTSYYSAEVVATTSTSKVTTGEVDYDYEMSYYSDGEENNPYTTTDDDLYADPWATTWSGNAEPESWGTSTTTDSSTATAEAVAVEVKPEEFYEQNAVVMYRDPEAAETPDESIVYMTNYQSGVPYTTTLTGIPTNVTLRAIAGASASDIILQYYNASGALIHTTTVMNGATDANQIIISGGASLDTSGLSADAAAHLFFNKTPPKSTSETLADDASVDLSSKEIANGNTYQYYVDGDNVDLNFSPDGGTYEISYVKNGEEYDAVLKFYNDQGALVTTASLTGLNKTSHINVNGAALKNKETVTDEDMQVVLGLTTEEEVLEADGHEVDETGKDLGVPDATVTALATKMNIDNQTLLEVYKSEVGTDYDGKKGITFEDLNAFIKENGEEMSSDFVKFLTSADRKLGQAHADLSDALMDPTMQQTEEYTAGNLWNAKKYTVSQASQDGVEAQEKFRDRLVELLKTTYKTASITTPKTASRQKITLESNSDWEHDFMLDGQDGADDIIFNGVKLDFIDWKTGDIRVTDAKANSDYGVS